MIAQIASTFRERANLIGWLLLAIWGVWWILTLAAGRLLEGDLTWINPSFGIDFLLHLDWPVRTWMANGDPFAERGPLFYSYPPAVLRLFAWTWLVVPNVGVRIWMCLAAISAAIGAVAAARTRPELGLAGIPAALAVAFLLFSFPVLFALDRANYDLIIVPLVVAAVMLMRRDTAAGDIIAGFLLALAIWCKLYPGLLFVGVLAVRRWRLAIWLVIGAGLIGLADPPQLLRFLANNNLQIDEAWSLARAFPTILPWNHPLPPMWHSLWAYTPLALVPGRVGAALLVGALLAWVSWRVYQCRDHDRLCLPYFFWIIALGSFVPPVANDYSLAPLLLAILATWGQRDHWIVHAVFGVLLLWWQPIALPLPGRVYLFIKLAGLVAAGYTLVVRASELNGKSFASDAKLSQPGLQRPALAGVAEPQP